MKIYVNDMELDFSLENEKTCGDILNQLEIEFEKNNGTIFSIKINDNDINAEKIDEIYLKPIEEIDSIKVISIFAQDIIDSLKSLSTEIEELNSDLEQLPVFLQGNSQSKVPVILTKFADIFDNLCHIISLSAIFPNIFDKVQIDNMSISDFIKDFGPLLEDFENAIKENDTVTIGDIAEYEIKPRFESLVSTVKDL